MSRPHPTFAYVCSNCDHLATRHRDRNHDGPYPCLHCDCVMAADDPTYGIDQDQARRLHGAELAANAA